MTDEKEQYYLSSDGKIQSDMNVEEKRKNDDYEPTYCAVHPDRETGLRCNKCGRYMCAECAVQTPVGYRCKQCTRQQEDKFFSATANDYLVLFAVCAGLGIVAGVIMGAVQVFGIFIALILGLPAGAAIANTALRAIKYRQGRNNAQAGVAGMVIGSILGAAARAFLAYPNEYREFHKMASENNVQIPPELLEFYPTLSTYVMDHTLNIGLIFFVSMAAYAVYYRMKS